ncbi:MAG: sulfatase-like hydrolase/transferase [Chitinivibrionales bacterium]|nr:sulfatase-like hydrolase/transferase [Chitinivibrionales bacterium]
MNTAASMTRRKAVRMVGAGISALSTPFITGCGNTTHASERPNIFLALADDWSWPHSGLAGSKAARTPVFDQCAREGAYFTNAFVSSPSCAPSRASILTGRHFWELEQGANLWGTLPADYKVYLDPLEKEGYYVGFSNKGWGPGSVKAGGRDRNPAGPKYANFEHFLSLRPKKAPFCFWFGSRDPHRYYGPRARISRKKDLDSIEVPPFLPDNEIVRRDMGNYFFEVQRFDRELGKALEMLEKRGELENTIVIITSDNGMPFPRCKANCYDWGVRVPLAVYWPGVIRSGTVIDDFVSLCDIAPTVLENCCPEQKNDMTGNSLRPLFDRSRNPGEKRGYALFGRERHVLAHGDTNHGYPVRAIRTESYLYIRNFKPERFPAGIPPAYRDCDSSPTKRYLLRNQDAPDVRPLFDLAFGKRPEEELYDLRIDPDQLNNVAQDNKYAAARQELWSTLKTALMKTDDPRILGKGDVFESYAFHTLKRLHQ